MSEITDRFELRCESKASDAILLQNLLLLAGYDGLAYV